jgi:hypothetical protein
MRGWRDTRKTLTGKQDFRYSFVIRSVTRRTRGPRSDRDARDHGTRDNATRRSTGWRDTPAHDVRFPNVYCHVARHCYDLTSIEERRTTNTQRARRSRRPDLTTHTDSLRTYFTLLTAHVQHRPVPCSFCFSSTCATNWRHNATMHRRGQSL